MIANIIIGILMMILGVLLYKLVETIYNNKKEEFEEALEEMDNDGMVVYQHNGYEYVLIRR